MNLKNNFDPYKDNNYQLLLNDLRFGKWTFPQSEHSLHKSISYDLNKDGYRSKEFDGSAEILTLGCSFTYGLGLPKEMMWAEILSDKLDKSIANLSQPGDSAEGQVRKAFSYFKKYNNPKIIIGLFPLYRMELPVVKDKLSLNLEKRNKSNINSIDKKSRLDIHEENSYEEFKKGYLAHKIKHFMFYDTIFEKYARAPYAPDRILPKEVSVFYTHSHINMLEQYCKSNNIKFIWSVWEDYENIYNFLIKENPEILENYCRVDWTTNFPNSLDADRHDKKCNLHIKNHDLFDFAADREGGLLSSHPGWHDNIHIAESFCNFIERT